MKKIFTHLSVFLVFFTLSATVFAQTNTFPATGNVGVGTITPTSLFQVNGGISQFGGSLDYARFAADGDLTFTGLGDYTVGGDRYAFRYGGNQNFGLFFNATDGRFEFRDATAATVFWITGGGNGYIKSKLAIGSTTTPGASLDITPANGAAIKINPFGVVAGNTGEIRFVELVANGTNYVGFKSPDIIAGNKIWTLPTADGTAGQYLKTDGTGKLGWASDAGSTYTAGTGLLLTGTVFSNTAPDQTVTLTGGGVTTISGTYPNFTVTTPAVAGPAGADGAAGIDGTDGVGIVSTIDNLDGTFTINYSDATSFTTSDLTGPMGATGAAGADGANGLNGADGATGATGPEGPMGAAGANGVDGTDGVGIVSTIDNLDGTFTINYSDATSFTTSDLTGPMGATGADGAVGATGATGPAGSANISGTTNYLVKFTGATTGSNSQLFDNGTFVGIGTTTPAFKLDVNADASFNGVRVGTGNGNIATNTAAGYQALNSNTTGFGNTANGGYALYSNITGYYNTANGFYALRNNTTGSNNTANGLGALQSNTTGFQNTANGSAAMQFNTTGSENTAIGRVALLFNTTGLSNTANGTAALHSNTTGSQNTANGQNALFNNTTGNNNTALGFSAGVATGALTNTTAIGNSATVNTSNKVRIGSTTVTVIEGQVAYSFPSDGRFKKNIKADVPGLEFINKLEPITYTFETQKFDEFLHQNNPDYANTDNAIDYSQSEKIIQSGFIAQDVEKVMQEVGYDFNGVHAPESDIDNYSMSYELMVVPMVKAIQELDAMNNAKDAKIDALVTENTTQQSAINNLQAQIDELKNIMLSATSAQNTNASNITLSEDKASSTITLNGAWLEQNVPNPFMGSTLIRCFIPEGFTSAEIVITAQNGVTLKRSTLNQSGINEVTVDASAITSGAYQYTLIVDGNVIGTKQMILTK